jgi:DNA-binding transcriptional regulator GbsR (MarR family)
MMGKESQIERVWACLYVAAQRGLWLTLAEISDDTGDPEASVSAQLRHLRKPRFGQHVIEKRRRSNSGRREMMWEYRMSGGGLRWLDESEENYFRSRECRPFASKHGNRPDSPCGGERTTRSESANTPLPKLPPCLL